MTSADAAALGAPSFLKYTRADLDDELREGRLPPQAVLSLRLYTEAGNARGLRIAYLHYLLADKGFRSWAVQSDPGRMIPVLFYLLRALPLYADQQTRDCAPAVADGPPPAFPTSDALVLDVVRKMRGGWDPQGRVRDLLASPHRDALIRDAIEAPHATAAQLGHLPHGPPARRPQNVPPGRPCDPRR
jgi:hypothetical protein